MNALVPLDDLAARRSAAAQKAWATRRALGWTSGTGPVVLPPRSDRRQAAADALAAFEKAAGSEAPDWHGAALALKNALQSTIDRPASTLRGRIERPLPGRPTALPARILVDYPIPRRASLVWPLPVAVVTFADGQTVRTSFASIVGKPLNIGRGVRHAIGAYRGRIARQWARGMFQAHGPGHGRCVAVPTIEACHVEQDGAQLATYDASLVTLETETLRAGTFDLVAVLAEAAARGLPHEQAASGELCTLQLVRLRYGAAAARHEVSHPMLNAVTRRPWIGEGEAADFLARAGRYDEQAAVVYSSAESVDEKPAVLVERRRRKDAP